MKQGVPFERFRWIANTFVEPVRQPDFDAMICSLAGRFQNGVRVVLFTGPKGPIVVTWLHAVGAA